MTRHFPLVGSVGLRDAETMSITRELDEALEQQRATSEVLRAGPSTPTRPASGNPFSTWRATPTSSPRKAPSPSPLTKDRKTAAIGSRSR
jgi:hypothetical protein